MAVDEQLDRLSRRPFIDLLVQGRPDPFAHLGTQRRSASPDYQVVLKITIGNTLIAKGDSRVLHDSGIAENSVVPPHHGQAFAAAPAHPLGWR